MINIFSLEIELNSYFGLHDHHLPFNEQQQLDENDPLMDKKINHDELSPIHLNLSQLFVEHR